VVSSVMAGSFAGGRRGNSSTYVVRAPVYLNRLADRGVHKPPLLRYSANLSTESAQF